jgi:hypothetical protein
LLDDGHPRQTRRNQAKGSAHRCVPMVASHMLAALLARRRFRVVSHNLSPNRDLPGLLDNYQLRFALA